MFAFLMAHSRAVLHAHLDMDRATAQVRVALNRAFECCGGQVAFCRKMNEGLIALGQRPVTKQAVQFWSSEGTFVDRRFWQHFETLTDMATTRRHLRPDIYGLAQP